MGRYTRNRLEEQELLRNNPDQQYLQAYKKVKRIKGFYIHLGAYLIVNVFIIAANIQLDDISHLWRWETFSTALFWGIGLAAHGLSVFGDDLVFNRQWEDKKIKELMDKEKSEKWE
jgi:hypothetical protein